MEPLAHRKAPARLQVLTPDGKPAVRRPVRVDQVSHQFLSLQSDTHSAGFTLTGSLDGQIYLTERDHKHP